jgi:CheY-like chemotaxis protein
MSNTRKVLVVDDEDTIRMLVKKVLERSGFEVAVARDGCEAIERLAADDFDVVLLDVMMPKLDGFGVVQQMQSTRPALLSRTLLVTASHLKSLQQLPVRGIITKPFSVGELLAETQKCCADAAA